ncbi:phosphatidylinositol-binding protein scs2 [Gaertneriomyces sp. JEL0708]|nr:phosphatidylinositol-binding protein scs2 [Gaertneriomyces sp. JEL0708]
MTDSKNYLTIDPSRELEFPRPLTESHKLPLTLYNNHPESAIAFKIKTTAPKQYCVRPNSGRIAPSGNTEVLVVLQGLKEEPPAGFRSRDKFLIQSIRIPGDVMALEGDELQLRLKELWANAEALKKRMPDAAAEVLVEKKLRCVFLTDDGDVKRQRHLSDISERGSPTRDSSVRQEFTDATGISPRASVASNLGLDHEEAADSGASPTYPGSGQPSENATESARGASEALQPSRGNLGKKPSTSHMPTPVPSADSPSTPSVADRELRDAREKIKTLQAACEGYKAEIERLNGLRQRSAKSDYTAWDSAGTGDARQGKHDLQHVGKQEGVGMLMAAFMAVVAFLFGVYYKKLF